MHNLTEQEVASIAQQVAIEHTREVRSGAPVRWKHVMALLGGLVAAQGVIAYIVLTLMDSHNDARYVLKADHRAEIEAAQKQSTEKALHDAEIQLLRDKSLDDKFRNISDKIDDLKKSMDKRS